MLSVISSMATKALLCDLAQRYRQSTGATVRIESVGGVEAARRIRKGEVHDLVVLASDAIATLAAEGLVQSASLRPIAESTVAIAVRDGAKQPAVDSEVALRTAVANAQRIGYSTGPSGTALLQLLERWGMRKALDKRLIQAAPGVPVAQLVRAGEADMGFQQLSELIGQAGIVVLGGMPAGCEIVTTFAGAIGNPRRQAAAAAAFLEFMCSTATDETKRQHGMSAPRFTASN